MIVSAEELRRRMSAHSDLELTEIISNGSGIYTADAIEAARRELTSRPPRSTEDYVAPIDDGDSRPFVIRAALWVATVLAITHSIYVVVTVVMSATGTDSMMSIPLLRHFVTAVILWWIAIGIRRESVYVPALACFA